MSVSNTHAVLVLATNGKTPPQPSLLNPLPRLQVLQISSLMAGGSGLMAGALLRGSQNRARVAPGLGTTTMSKTRLHTSHIIPAAVNGSCKAILY
jgi:hypothetical protein